jgi:hypothetical protein
MLTPPISGRPFGANFFKVMASLAFSIRMPWLKNSLNDQRPWLKVQGNPSRSSDTAIRGVTYRLHPGPGIVHLNGHGASACFWFTESIRPSFGYRHLESLFPPV